MTSKQASTLRTGSKLRWIADGTLGEIIEHQIEGKSTYWFKVRWADGQVCQYTTGRHSDLEYMERAQ